VLDEPTASLDFGNQCACARTAAPEGYAVVFSTDDPGQARGESGNAARMAAPPRHSRK
jgi:ABC-type cobalamin/Fe3+-siderophores transport system ATPase subunit